MTGYADNVSADLRIAISQLNLLVGDVAGNVERVIEQSCRARDELHAQAVVFPELTLVGYPPEDLLLRPALHAQIEQGLSRIGEQAGGIDVIVGYPRLDDDNRLFNAVAVIRDGRVVASYAKQFLPNYSVFDEKRYFTAGHDACVVDIAGVPVGLTLCEDLWNAGPAAMSRAAGARLLIGLNASPFHAGKHRERLQVIRSRVAESGLPVIYANLVGGQDELVFDGDSFVVDDQGQETLRLAAFSEALAVCEFGIAHDGRVMPKPAAQAALPDDDESIYQALLLGVRDYIEKNHFRGVVIGLSGGVDSALTLALAVDAIGHERVEAVMMPSRYTAAMSIEDAELQCRALAVESHLISIEPVFQAFLTSLADEFAGTQVDTTEENIQARCRGVILMAISNKKRKIVLTTGNKSEMAVGYATLYGDMAGGFAPLKDVPKTLVYRLCRYRNTISSVIPQRVLERPPSAELAPDQKDTDSLPDYDVLDPILELYVEEDRSPEEIVQHGYDEQAVQRVVYLVNRNEYKRRQAPPGVRISRRAFGRDRRYPITSAYHEQ